MLGKIRAAAKLWILFNSGTWLIHACMASKTGL